MRPKCKKLALSINALEYEALHGLVEVAQQNKFFAEFRELNIAWQLLLMNVVGKSQSTQVGKGSSEEKNDQWIMTSKFVMGMFMWFKIAKDKKIHWAILEGRWYTGRKIRQIWAEWAVCVGCYLQNGSVNISVFCNFESHKHTHNKF